MVPKIIGILLDIRQKAKENKDYALSDRIRDDLAKIGITVKDRKGGAEWEIT